MLLVEKFSISFKVLVMDYQIRWFCAYFGFMLSFVRIFQYLCYMKSNDTWVNLIPFEMFHIMGKSRCMATDFCLLEPFLGTWHFGSCSCTRPYKVNYILSHQSCGKVVVLDFRFFDGKKDCINKQYSSNIYHMIV